MANQNNDQVFLILGVVLILLGASYIIGGQLSKGIWSMVIGAFFAGPVINKRNS